MRLYWLAVLAALAPCLPASPQAAQADGAHLPPLAAKDLAQALHPIPQRTLEGYLRRLQTTHTFDEFAGRNAELRKTFAGVKPLAVGRNFPVGMDSGELFGNSFMDGAHRIFQAGVISMDAEAMRLKADLTGLGRSDELFAVDAATLRAFGPYTREDALDGGNWLAATEGSAAVLILRTAADRAPRFELLEISHMFRAIPPAKAAEPCHNNIACEDDAALQDVSTGVARFTYSEGSLLYVCTATLINNPVTPELEPYILTANHCLSSGFAVTTAEFYWDYRAATCDANYGPSLGLLPRSNGSALVDTDARLDITLATVDEAPSGRYGRFWAGWSASALTLNEGVVGIHHPDGGHMRISYGRIAGTSVTTFQFDDQIEVVWDALGFDSGFTEGGSSGSGLLPERLGYRLTGVLSNGNFVDCDSPLSQRWDRYASFAEFYPAIRDYVNGTALPPAGNGGPGNGACAAKSALADYPEALERLRALRDVGLDRTALGRALTRSYYRAAPVLARIVERNEDAKGLFIAAAGPAARVGAWLQR